VASGLLLRRGRSNAGQRVATQASTGAREELRTVGMHGKKRGASSPAAGNGGLGGAAGAAVAWRTREGGGLK
jgi:hypothetical protein